MLSPPPPRASLVLGKILGGTTQAFLPGILFLLLAPAICFSVHPAQLFWLAVILFWIAFSLTTLGFLVAWKMDSAQGFHSVLNLVLIPMWLLSGALFPASGA